MIAVHYGFLLTRTNFCSIWASYKTQQYLAVSSYLLCLPINHSVSSVTE